MPPKRLFVIRVGDPNGLWATWHRQNKWSTPDAQTGQPIRNAWVEGAEVHILFVGTGDIPLHYGVLSGVRARNPEIDINFPTRTEQGELQTFLMFEGIVPVQNSFNSNPEIFQGILDEIRYQRGSQIQISSASAANIFIFNQGFALGQLYRQPPPQNQVFVNNTVVANPNSTINLNP